MPAFCFLNSVSMAADQTSVAKGIRAATYTFTFEVVTRTGAGVLVSGPTGINVINREYTFVRVRWDLGTTTVYIDGSNTQRVDEWVTIGNLPVVVGAATLLSVTLG